MELINYDYTNNNCYNDSGHGHGHDHDHGHDHGHVLPFSFSNNYVCCSDTDREEDTFCGYQLVARWPMAYTGDL